MLTFTAVENSETLGADKGLDKGFVVHRVDAHTEGNNYVGYVKISYIPSERIPEMFPTVWHFLQLWRGKGLGLRDSDYKIIGAEFLEDRKVLTKVWSRIHLSLLIRSPSCPSVPFNALCEANAPSMEVMRLELERLSKRKGFEQEMEEEVSYHRDRPFVDFIRVKDPFLGQHLAIPLYVGAAKWLAEAKGMALRASGVQVGEAPAKLWGIMEQGPEYPTLRVLHHGRSFPVLDYTEGQTFSKAHYEVET